MAGRRGLGGLWLGVACALLIALSACQGTSPSGASARPRSREAAGEQNTMPFETDISKRMGIDTIGGELEFRRCKITVPVGAMTEVTFVEISLPSDEPMEVVPGSVYLISPSNFELKKDALLRITYKEEDLGVSQDENDLAIVHLVDGVWVELPNSEVDEHINSVEAPVRYLGTFALRMRVRDPRYSNQLPLAVFEWSNKPFAAMSEEPEPVAESAPAEAPPADGSAAGPAAGGSAVEGPAEPAAPPTAWAPPAASTPGAGKVRERRIVAGPEDPPKAVESELGSGAGNVAEGSSPGDPGVGVEGPAEGPPAEGEALESEAAKKKAAEDENELGGTVIYFDASQSSDPDGEVVQYDWDFDCDGIFDFTSHRGPYAKHAFKTSGDYTVVLKVTDNGRYTQVGYGTSVVTIRDPRNQQSHLAANISAYPPAGPIPLTVHYATTVTGGSAPYTYNWEFDDGSQSNLANPYTTYVEPGDKVIRYTVTDLLGEKLEGSLVISVCDCEGPPPPERRMLVDISPGTEQGQAPLKAKFVLSAERASGPVTYRILFGDEAPGEEETVSTSTTYEHVYTNAGFYLVKVIATDAELRTGSSFASVNAISPEMARDFVVSDAAASGDPFGFGSDMRILFDITEASRRTVRFSVEDAPRLNGELSFQWDFGDGTFSTESIARKTYARDGVYEVRLLASDGVQNWRKRLWLPISADGTAVAIQRPAFIEGPSPLRLTFDNIVTRGEEPLAYDWHFNDYRRSDPSTFYTFNAAGEYEVGLTVKDRHRDAYNSPVIKVRVREGTARYRQPLAVIEPLNGSTRAAVVDYDGADPMPMSSSSSEGPVSLVNLSADGERVAVVTEDGVLVKAVNSAEPQLSFLPAAGKVVAAIPLEGEAAYVTVKSTLGLQTYLVRPGVYPQTIGTGLVETASGNGAWVVIKDGDDPKKAALAKLFGVDTENCLVSDSQPLGRVFQARLTRDGSHVWLLSDDGTILRQELASGRQETIARADGTKYQLAVAGGGSSAAWVFQEGERKSIVVARQLAGGEFELTNLTDQSGLFSEHFELSADGHYLLTYGSRRKLAELWSAARKKKVTEDEVTVEIVTSYPKGPPPPARERFGVIRLDLAGPSDDWTLVNLNPRFVIESQPNFASAGPF